MSKKEKTIITSFPSDKEFINEMTLFPRVLYYLGCLKKTHGKVYGYKGKMRYEQNYKFRLWHPITIVTVIVLYIVALLGGIISEPIRSAKECVKVVKDGVNPFIDKEIRLKKTQEVG